VSPVLRITTYNIHKGFSQFNRRLTVHELRDRLRGIDSDIVFLQEVQGAHSGHATLHGNWPSQPQHEFLAEDVWPDSAYGHNMVYDHGHHGNAILSRYPIIHSHNQDVTHLKFEHRGLLHSSIAVPGFDGPIHCVCAHLSLFGRSRRFQINALVEYLKRYVPEGAPLIVAGDFNDWRVRAHDMLPDALGMVEAFSLASAKPARSFPAAMPFFRLDRVYVRGLRVMSNEIHSGLPWSDISDHAALSVTLSPLGEDD